MLAPEDAGLVEAVEAGVEALVPEDAVLVVEDVAVVPVLGDAAVVPEEVVPVLGDAAVVPEEVVVVPLVVGTFVVDVAVEALELLVVDAAAGDCDASPPQAASDSTDTAKVITTATRFPIKISLLPISTTQDAACRCLLVLRLLPTSKIVLR